MSLHMTSPGFKENGYWQWFPNCYLFVTSPDDLPELEAVVQKLGTRHPHGAVLCPGPMPHYYLPVMARYKAHKLGAKYARYKRFQAIKKTWSQPASVADPGGAS